MLVRSPALVSLPFALLMFLASCAPSATSPLFASEITNDEPLKLTGDEDLTIRDIHYVERNNILLEGRSRLIIEDALFEHRQGYSHQFSLEARDQAQVIVRNAEIQSSDWLNWNFSDGSSLVLDNVLQGSSGIWHSFNGTATASVEGSKFHATIGGGSHFDIRHSPDLFIEIVAPTGAIVDAELPARLDDFTFPGPGDSSIPLSLHVTDSVATRWGITINPQSNVTIRNAGPLVVTLAFGEPWHGVTAELNNLRAMLYEDRTWRVNDLTLRLVNVRTDKWSPIVGGDNTLIIKGSDLADNAFSWGHARVIITDSSMTLIRARDDVNMEISNSTVSGDVIAAGNSRITLTNTTVKGQTVTRDNGTIVNQPAQ